MVRVKIVVEGQSEEGFVNDVLAPTFWPQETYLFPILLGVPGQKGGRPSYARLKKDLLLHLKQDQSAYCSMMLDYYGLGPGYPGAVPDGTSSASIVQILEDAIQADINETIPELRPDRRLIPYLQLHEYEGLLFSDPPAFANGINQAHLGTVFQVIRNGFPTPEDINNSPTTAPSKRVLTAYPPYRKVLHGKNGAAAVGIDRMRQECPHFRAWLETLETLTPL